MPALTTTTRRAHAHHVLAATTAVATAVAALATAIADRPNVVVILTDDQGWGDLSGSGNTNLTGDLDDSARPVGWR